MKNLKHHDFSELGVGPFRDLAGVRLEGYSNTKLAQRFGCSERTIKRRLHLIREKCQQGPIKFNEHPSEKTTDCRIGTH
ncbi:MAG: ECF-type sigma factor [Fuerstiella sp.]